jgi:hypothetical protein
VLLWWSDRCKSVGGGVNGGQGGLRLWWPKLQIWWSSWWKRGKGKMIVVEKETKLQIGSEEDEIFTKMFLKCQKYPCVKHV